LEQAVFSAVRLNFNIAYESAFFTSTSVIEKAEPVMALPFSVRIVVLRLLDPTVAVLLRAGLLRQSS